MSTPDEPKQRDLHELYAACYQRLVAVVGAIAGSQHEAEEAVQDAFVRLIGQWSTVSRYENPEAWLRKVALGAVSNRRRKAIGGVRALRRHGTPVEVAETTGDGIDLHRALRPSRCINARSSSSCTSSASIWRPWPESSRSLSAP